MLKEYLKSKDCAITCIRKCAERENIWKHPLPNPKTKRCHCFAKFAICCGNNTHEPTRRTGERVGLSRHMGCSDALVPRSRPSSDAADCCGRNAAILSSIERFSALPQIQI